MKIFLSFFILLTLCGCTTVHQGESYGSIATEAFIEGVSPHQGWFDNTWRAVGSVAGHTAR
jgi:hypothetical protein